MSTNAASDLMKTRAVSRGLNADKFLSWNIELLLLSGIAQPTGHTASAEHGWHIELLAYGLKNPPRHGTHSVSFTVVPGGQGTQLVLREEP